MTPTPRAPAQEAAAPPRQFISCTIDAEEYGIDIIAIREIKGWTPTTALPETPPHMRGVIDLRGSIIPILDLRARFLVGLGEMVFGGEPKVMITEALGIPTGVMRFPLFGRNLVMKEIDVTAAVVAW